MAFTDSADNAPSFEPDEGGGGGGGGGAPGGAAAGPPPPGGGPILAALARRNMSPPVSTPGPGNMAQGLMMLKQAVDLIHTALPNLEGKPHQDAVKALGALGRHLPQGQPTAGVQQTQLQDMLRNTMRNALLQRIMGQQQGGPGAQGGGAGGAGAGAGPQQPSMPTQPVPATPLPGA